MRINLLEILQKRKQKKLPNEPTEKSDVEIFKMFKIDESILERANPIKVDLEYTPKCIDNKEYSRNTDLLFVHGSQFMDLKHFFSTNILEIYSVLCAMEDDKNSFDQSVFNSYLELLFINIFNFSEYSLQFFNGILDLKLAESRHQCDEIKSQRDYYKKLLPKIELEILNAKSDRKYELEIMIEIANLKNSDIRHLTLGNFKKRVGSKYVPDKYLKLLLKKFESINNFKKIRNSIAHRRSLNFRSNKVSTNPYSNVRIVDITSKLTRGNLLDEPNDNFMLPSKELTPREVLEMCAKIIEDEKKIMDIAYTYLSGKIYPVKSENCGAKYYLTYYRCTRCKHVFCYNPLSYKTHCVLTQFPEHLHSILCCHCLQKTTQQKVFSTEITEYFNIYQSCKIIKQHRGEININFLFLIHRLSYYSKFITLNSMNPELVEHLRKDNYRNIYKKLV